MTTQGTTPTAGLGWRPSRAWAIDTGERVARTFLQAFGGGLTVSALTGISGWKTALAAGFASVYSLIMSLIAPHVTRATTSASLLPPLVGVHSRYGTDRHAPEPRPARVDTAAPPTQEQSTGPQATSAAPPFDAATYPDAKTTGVTPTSGAPSPTIYEDAMDVSFTRAQEQADHDETEAANEPATPALATPPFDQEQPVAVPPATVELAPAADPTPPPTPTTPPTPGAALAARLAARTK